MELHKYKQRTIGLRLLCIISLVSCAANFIFIEKQQNSLVDVNSSFKFAIREDKNIRMGNLRIPTYFGYRNGSKEYFFVEKNDQTLKNIKKEKKYRKLSIEEKITRADQTYLQYKSPIKIHILDSLFKLKLKESNIFLQTEIKYIANKDTAYSTKNQAFYTAALPLEKIITGIDFQLELQAFVKMPFLYRISTFIYIVTSLLFLISVGGLIFVRKKSDEELLAEEADSFIVPYSIRLSDFAKQITPTIFFDKEKKAIIRNGDITYLAGAKLAIFNLMMANDDYFVQTVVIKDQLWPKNDDVKDVLNKAMERLRKGLNPIPEFEILYDNKRVGYYLKVTKLEDVK